MTMNFFTRLICAARVLTGKRIIVIDAVLEKEKDRMAVHYYTTIPSEQHQITYLRETAKSVEYDLQQAEEKKRMFIAQNN